jgi:hypothetical protein
VSVCVCLLCVCVCACNMLHGLYELIHAYMFLYTRICMHLFPCWTCENFSFGNQQSAALVQVKDICFLHRYNAPVLLILHEAAPSWPGRHKDVRDTCELIAISLDLSGGVEWGGHFWTLSIC